MDLAEVDLGIRIGPYRLLEKIGVGGMAAVYRARRNARPTEPVPEAVALKLMNAELSQDDEIRRRFRREVRITTRLDHPNIVRTIHFGDHKGLIYIVMELVQGHTLRDLMGQRLFAPAEALRILKPLSLALHYAHHLGIVHRDVKPENVMIQHDGRLKVMDFGVARGQDDVTNGRLTIAGVAVGTPAYMAPEQVQGTVEGDAPCPASDQYSLGCLIYELLTGHVPFESDTPLQVMQMQVVQDPPPMQGLANTPLEAVVFRMLAKRPEDRFPSVKDAYLALEASIPEHTE